MNVAPPAAKSTRDIEHFLDADADAAERAALIERHHVHLCSIRARLVSQHLAIGSNDAVPLSDGVENSGDTRGAGCFIVRASFHRRHPLTAASSMFSGAD